MNLTFNADYAPFIKGEKTQNPIIAILVREDSNAKHATVLVPAKGKVDLQTLKASEFKKLYMGVSHGDDFRPERYVGEWMAAPKMKISDDAMIHIERILKMDTRGKTAAQIREEVARIAVELPEGNTLRAVPESFKDRQSAISAYTAVRQELFKLGKQETPMAKTKANGGQQAEQTTTPAAQPETAKDAKGTKASKGAKATAAKAAKKAGTRKAADFSGSYKVAGDAAKAKNTEELGMHEDSVRTKVLGAVMKSKAKDGVDFASLEKVAGDKTRGAIAYLVKRGFLARAAK